MGEKGEKAGGDRDSRTSGQGGRARLRGRPYLRLVQRYFRPCHRYLRKGDARSCHWWYGGARSSESPRSTSSSERPEGTRPRPQDLEPSLLSVPWPVPALRLAA